MWSPTIAPRLVSTTTSKTPADSELKSPCLLKSLGHGHRTYSSTIQQSMPRAANHMNQKSMSALDGSSLIRVQTPNMYKPSDLASDRMSRDNDCALGDKDQVWVQQANNSPSHCVLIRKRSMLVLHFPHSFSRPNLRLRFRPTYQPRLRVSH